MFELHTSKKKHIQRWTIQPFAPIRLVCTFLKSFSIFFLYLCQLFTLSVFFFNSFIFFFFKKKQQNHWRYSTSNFSSISIVSLLNCQQEKSNQVQNYSFPIPTTLFPLLFLLFGPFFTPLSFSSLFFFFFFCFYTFSQNQL